MIENLHGQVWYRFASSTVIGRLDWLAFMVQKAFRGILMLWLIRGGGLYALGNTLSYTFLDVYRRYSWIWRLLWFHDTLQW